MNKSLCIKSWATAGFACVLVAGAVSTPAAAHHSFAMYDQKISRTLTGKLTRFIPGANHAQLYFELVGPDGKVEPGENGKPAIWGVEMGPAARIAQQGITVESFPLGTVFTVTLNPLRDGRPFGAMARGSSIVKCGMQMPEGGCTPETGEVFFDDDDD